MKVVINKQKVTLDEKDVLGSGGEALVLRHGSQAVKLYHDPTPARAAKLLDLLTLAATLPAQVVRPLEPVYDKGGTKLIGFCMQALPPQLEVLASLSNKNFRAKHGVTACQVTSLFLSMHQTLTALHQAGLRIGDFNDLNILVEGNQAFFIDADSYQFGKYPCPVATEAFLDPQLYGFDLTAKPLFLPEHDWYSYAVQLFRALLLVHPYGGTHPHVKTLTQRAKQQLTVFHADVTYPKIGLPPSCLDDELASIFQQIFGAGWRGIFPLDVLQVYADSLRECATCHLWFPASRGLCPICQSVGTFVLPKIKVSANIRAEEWLAAKGRIVFVKAQGDQLYCVAREENTAVLYLRPKSAVVQRIELFNWLAGATYDFMDGYIVVNPHASADLMLLELDGTTIKPFLKTVTGQFGGKAVFAATAKYLYRIAGNLVMRGEIKYGQLVERPICSVLEGQSWFVASDNQVLIGFSRVFREWQWFRVDENGRENLAVTPLHADEALLEYAVKQNNAGSLIARKTRQLGVDYLRLDAFDNKGQPLYSQRRKFEELADFNQELDSFLYMGGVALWPAGVGIIKEKVEQRQQVELSATASYVNASTQLTFSSAGLLATTDNVVWNLTLL